MKFYSRLEAKERIKEIIASGTPIKTGLKIPIRYNKSFNSYSLPIDILVPNVKNDRIASQVSEGSSVVLVSHEEKTIREMCNKVIWLEGGNIRMIGKTEEVMNAYKQVQGL
jgi:hypothetical protein